MAMNKREAALVADLENRLALSQAMRLSLENPKPMDIPPWGKTAVGWWFNVHNYDVGEGCFHKGGHSRWRTDKVSSQGDGGPWYASQADALRALRFAAAEKFASVLADIDRRIAKCA